MKIRPALLTLFLLLPAAAAKDLPKPLPTPPAAKVLVVPFANRTGEASLDWVSFGLQDAISADVGYIKGLDSVAVVFLPKDPPLRSWSTTPPDELLKSLEYEQFDQVWSGHFSGDAKKLSVEMTVSATGSRKVLGKEAFFAPLEGSLTEASRAVLRIADGQGLAPSEEARARILSRKTGSADAWKWKTEGLLHLKEYLDSTEGPGGTAGESILKLAEEALGRATALDPLYAEALDDLGLSYIFTRQAEKALAAIDRSLEIKPYLVNALMYRGMLAVLSDVPRALECFRKATEVNPSLSPYHDALFEILSSLDRKEEALKYASGLLRNSSTAGKIKAINFLVGTGGKTVLPLLVGAVDDPDSVVRGRALDGLWYLGDKTVVPHFLTSIRDPDDQVRQVVIQALGSAWPGDPRIGPALRAALKSPDPRTRENAARALGNIHETGALSDLIGLLKDPASGARREAAAALGRMGDKAAVPALQAMLHDADSSVCASAAKSLRALGGPPPGPSFGKDLKAPDVNVRRRAALVLAEFPEASAFPFLFEALDDPDKDVRYQAAYALRRSEDRTILPRMIAAMKNADDIVRAQIASYLAKTGGPDAVTALMKALGDGSFVVRYIALRAVGAAGGRDHPEAALAALKDPDIQVRLEALPLLGRSGGPPAVSALIGALEDPDDSIRSDAAKALGEVKSETAIPSLLKALNDPWEDVGFEAASALARMGNAAGAEILASGLGSRTVRESAIEGLIQLGETARLYGYFEQTSDLFVLNQLRRRLVFSGRTDALSTLPDPFLKSAGLYLRALRARESGKHDEQLDLVRQALGHVDPQDRSAWTVLCLWLEAQAEMKLDRLKDAAASVAKAEEVLERYSFSVKEKEGFEEPFVAQTLFLKGEILAATGEGPPAAKAFEEALAKLEQSREDYLLREPAERLEVMVRTSLGALQVRIGKGNLERAVESGRNYQTSDSVEMESEEKRYLELARQKIAEGDYEESQRLIEELNLRRSNYINRRTRIRLADAESQKAVDAFQKKQEDIESLSKRIEGLAQQKAGRGGDNQADEEMKALEADRNARRRELQVYLTQLKRTQPNMAALLGAKPMEITAIQDQLPADTALLQYLLLPEKLVIFIIRANDIRIVETPARKGELLAKVESLRKAIFAKAEDRDVRTIKPLSRELYGWLIKPVEEGGGLKDVQVVGIAPNGFLHQLPFGVLVDPEDRYLVDRYAFFYLNSTSILGVALARGNPRVSGRTAFLGISNPDETLDFADVEVNGIAKLFGRKTVYSKGEAKKSVLQDRKGDDVIIHLSTHGLFDPTDSTRSYLLMSDGRLSVEDIWGLPLKGTSLTVLSACETGVGEVLSGDDVVSLENAFIFAGSPAVVATLWSVADESTAELMGAFYADLIQGKTRVESLTEAQRKLKKRYDHPFFWAAFTLRGDWR